MTDIRALIESTVASSPHLAKRHVHPRLMQMFELGDMTAIFERASGAHLWDLEGRRFLDLLSGGGVHFIGRNHPAVQRAIADVAGMDLPNLCTVNASLLGGLVAERLLALTGDGGGKVVFASSGSEITDVALRFARYATRRPRFLHLEGAFHGRTFGAISVNGWSEMRAGMAPTLPECVALPLNDLGALRRELAKGDVAALIVEPVQGMTLTPLDPAWLREAEALCRRYGTLWIADEIQTGLGRCGAWFLTREYGLRPDLTLVSKALSGGQVPVSAMLVTDALYTRVYDEFKAVPFHYSTFGENNLAMAAAIATLDVLVELDAPARARALSARLRAGLDRLAREHDQIERIAGLGLMIGVYFRPSATPFAGLEQRLLGVADPSSFGAALNIELYVRHRVLVQVPGPGLDAIKILPPLVMDDSDVDWFLDALDETLRRWRRGPGPTVTLARGFVNAVRGEARRAIGREPPAPRRPGVVEAHPHAIDERCDVVVVGSGPGGVIAALAAAEAGRQVILLEAGPVARERGDTLATLSRYFYEAGARAGVGNAYLATLQARCLGGGSVFNSAICMRPSAFALRVWEEEHGVHGCDPDALEPDLAAVEALLGIAPTHEAVLGHANAPFARGCAAMGWRAEPTPRSAPGCEGSGRCILGCPGEGKRSLDRVGVPELLARGGRVHTSVRVERVLTRGGRAIGVEGWALDEARRPTHRVRIRARSVIVAAGALATPVLLRRSGLRHAGIGAKVLFHPSTNVTVILRDRLSRGPAATQGYHCTDFLEAGFKLESLWLPPELAAGRLPGVGDGLLDLLSAAPRSVTWALWASGTDSHGTIGGSLERADLRVHLGTADVRRIHEGVARLVEMANAIDAEGVATGLHGLPRVISGEDAPRRVRALAPDPLGAPWLISHVFGSVPMGGDPVRAPVDSTGRVREIDDLWVADGSLLPATPGANPMLTIMALARRVGRTAARS